MLSGGNCMVDETGGDGGRNGTGEDGGNADRPAVNSTFRPTSDSHTHRLHHVPRPCQRWHRMDTSLIDGDAATLQRIVMLLM